jgi:hypothetical protein
MGTGPSVGRWSKRNEEASPDLGPAQDDLLEQLLLFPEGAHDDLIDALMLAIEVQHGYGYYSHDDAFGGRPFIGPDDDDEVARLLRGLMDRLRRWRGGDCRGGVRRGPAAEP